MPRTRNGQCQRGVRRRWLVLSPSSGAVYYQWKEHSATVPNVAVLSTLCLSPVRADSERGLDLPMVLKIASIDRSAFCPRP